MLAAFRFFLRLLAVLAFLGCWPRLATAQPATGTRTTYYDAAHTQRRAAYGFVLLGARPDTVPHGPYRRFWRTGTLAELGHFTNGQADSTWTRYYPAQPGQVSALARRLPMRGGQPDGPFTVWHPGGQLAQRGTFQQGQLLDSIVTLTASGQPRLLARLVPDSAGRLAPTGHFRQWYSRVTAQPLGSIISYEQASYSNPYPATDTGRYWVGQLAAGRFMGPLAEHDADGQLRVRLLYGPPGQVRLTSLYYPAAWRKYELSQSYQRDSGQVRSQPYWHLQRLGRNLLWQYYEWNSSPDRGAASLRVISPTPVPHLPRPTTCLQAPLPLVVLPANGPRLSARAAFNPRYQYGPDLRQQRPPTHSKYGTTAELRHRKAEEQHLLKGRTRHLMGQTDTLTGTFSRQRRLVETDQNGRSVTTGATLRLYAPDGSLSSTSRKKRRYEVERDYEKGHLVSYQKHYYDDRQRIREWDDQGRLKYDARTTRHGTTYSRRRDRHGHLPPRRRLTKPMPMD